MVKARNELAQQIKRDGEQACQDIGLTNVHPELARLLGTLRFRNSYGHKRPRAQPGHRGACRDDRRRDRFRRADCQGGGAVPRHRQGRRTRRGRPPRDHRWRDPGTPRPSCRGRSGGAVASLRRGAAVLRRSDPDDRGRDQRGAPRRPTGARWRRRSSVYLERIEAISNEFHGVERSFAVALPARELRVLVKPDEIKDDEAQIMARLIAKRLHGEGSYSAWPGQGRRPPAKPVASSTRSNDCIALSGALHSGKVDTCAR